MKKTFLTFLCLTIALFVTDRTGGIVMQWVCRHSNDVLSPKLQYVQDGIHEDMVLMGTSRCHHHYVPSIISDSVGITVYNAGVGGSGNIFAHYIMLCHILSRYTPKIICLDVAPTDYNQQRSPFSGTNLYSSLFGRNESADSVYRLAESYWPYKISHLYRYNVRASSNLWGLLLNRQQDSDMGYIPLPCPEHRLSAPEFEDTDQSIDSLKMEYLKRFIAECRQRKIKLVFVASPKYTLVDNSYYGIFRSIADEYSIPFLDYHTSKRYQTHPELFKDVNHLWDQGARLFSREFSCDLKQIFH